MKSKTIDRQAKVFHISDLLFLNNSLNYCFTLLLNKCFARNMMHLMIILQNILHTWLKNVTTNLKLNPTTTGTNYIRRYV